MKLGEFTRILPAQEKALKKLGVLSALDLLYHFPTKYNDLAEATTIASLKGKQSVVVFGRISNLETKKGFRSKVPMATARVTDDTGSIEVVWFHQAYLAKMFIENSLVRVEGVTSERKNGALYFSNPKIESVSKVPTGVGDSLFTDTDDHSLHPTYPETKGITSNWMLHVLQRIFASPYFEHIPDPIPGDILEKYNLPRLQTALAWIHAPKKKEHYEMARKRFSFEEIFFIQLARQQEKHLLSKEHSYAVDIPDATINQFISRFPFKFTDGQMKAINDIRKDFATGHPMSRLLEGDVGSGKTAVAAATAFAITVTRPFDKARGKPQTFGTLQTAYMAPTEILAKQHFESFIQFFSHLPIQIGLITGSGCKKYPSKVHPDKPTDISRTQLLKWVKNGEISILIGTHALIQKSVEFKHLAYVIIDEQHRFGVNQRHKVARKDNHLPHLLSMTATPIPRTLALTLYGDLDLTILDQMPTGRKPVITEIIMPKDRTNTYEKIRHELQAGRQAYIICPRINEPDPDKEVTVNARSAVAEAKHLKEKIFPEYTIGVMHSKMTPKAKDDVMKDFSEGKVHILVSTSVVEVGVNVPNATVMIIEGGERFGLAQLHQLRGRVVRSNHQAYCYIAVESTSTKTAERLKAIKNAKNGFELAEADLAQRGAGGLSEGKQWGVSDLGMEAIKNIKMVEAARTEATALIATDATLAHHPLLLEKIAVHRETHFE
ncbi:MAG: ATP-dependent helicase RecG, ATP-dependent helicase RecG [Candidatus Parcubacteria bacterium]